MTISPANLESGPESLDHPPGAAEFEDLIRRVLILETALWPGDCNKSLDRIPP